MATSHYAIIQKINLKSTPTRSRTSLRSPGSENKGIWKQNYQLKLMKISVKLQELIPQPEAAILSISSLMGQKLALVDCTNLASLTPWTTKPNFHPYSPNMGLCRTHRNLWCWHPHRNLCYPTLWIYRPPFRTHPQIFHNYVSEALPKGALPTTNYWFSRYIQFP